MKGKLRVAMCCLNMSRKLLTPKAFVRRIDRLLLDTRRRTDVLLLPEYAFMSILCEKPDGLPESQEVPWMAKLAEEEGMVGLLQQLARDSGQAFLAGTWPVKTENGYVNRAHFFDIDGEVHTQDKISLTDEETDRIGWYLKPGNRLDVFEVGNHKCAIAICHDTAHKEEFTEMEDAGVDAVFMPSMCEFEGNRKSVDGHLWIFEHARLRSQETGATFFCVGSIGPQEMDDRTQNNVGGAAVYQKGNRLAEIGPFSSCEDNLGPILLAEM